MGERLTSYMPEHSNPSPTKPEGSSSERHPGVPPTDIEKAAVAQHQKKSSEKPSENASEKPTEKSSEEKSDAVTILNNRIRPITNHSGKTTF